MCVCVCVCVCDFVWEVGEQPGLQRAPRHVVDPVVLAHARQPGGDGAGAGPGRRCVGGPRDAPKFGTRAHQSPLRAPPPAAPYWPPSRPIDPWSPQKFRKKNWCFLNFAIFLDFFNNFDVSCSSFFCQRSSSGAFWCKKSESAYKTTSIYSLESQIRQNYDVVLSIFHVQHATLFLKKWLYL